MRFLRGAATLLFFVYLAAVLTGRAGWVNRAAGYYGRETAELLRGFSQLAQNSARGFWSGSGSREPSILRE